MAGATIAGVVVAVVAVAAAAVTTVAAVQQAENQAKIAKAQARFAALAAKSTEEAAGFQERQARRQGDIVLGKLRAIAAASGLDPTFGSPLLAELDTAREIELEALNIRAGGDITAFQQRFQGQLSAFEARSIRRQIPLITIGGIAGAASAGLTAAKPLTAKT